MTDVTDARVSWIEIRTLIREIHEAEPTLDNADVARLLADRLSAEELREAFVIVATNYVRATREAPPRAPTLSARRPPAKDVGAAYMRVLGSHIRVRHGWKPLADCTRGDLLFAVQLRVDEARRVARVGQRLERLAIEMGSRGAATVSDLPEPLVMELLRPIARDLE